MRTLLVSDGDIALNDHGRVQEIQGIQKLSQDLRLWLMEPLGAGFLTPYFGSDLTDQIGQLLDKEVLIEIEDEIHRVLSVYQSNQIETIREARASGHLREMYGVGEVLDEIIEVRARGIRNRVEVRVVIETVSEQQLLLNLELTENGVEIDG